MTRQVFHSAHAPQAVPKTAAAGDHLYVCRCGLSASPYGLCDGSHKQALDEQPGLTYLYERKDGKLVRVALPTATPTPTPTPTAPHAEVPPIQVAGGSA
jgi:CDGSH-type Zn-finger protein